MTSYENPVELVWSTPNGEDLIAYMARVSAPENQHLDGTGLVNYLVKHHHWSPFEMVNLVFEITTTRDIARQLLRHRSFSFQEFSQRYAEVTKLEKAPLRECRLQDNKNRQNSLDVDDPKLHDWWYKQQSDLEDYANRVYNAALHKGIAKEVARSVLPEGLTTSRLYMNGTLRSWAHFLKLRLGNGTQKETQLLAQLLAKEVEKQYPTVWKALTE
jgi:thymidylate synthase (FAD)